MAAVAGKALGDSAFSAPGQRGTRQRRVIREWLGTSAAFVSAQQVREGIAAKGDAVGLTTVYRTLQALADAGEVDVLRTDTGEALYRKCGTGHHHHLTCRSCELTIELAGPPSVEKWSQSTADEFGFNDVQHVIELSGTCSNCR
ncbi:MAG: transcriptional repressor [Actinobacteria bacterium]|nr:transcriptional repressor [Actinomycetota bacterium]